ncbi:uncharacterized protein LOC108675662 [Hyalella azteca]|uniref:Uncharacterized protein LOC108675662 n=1 Tax=Hyalella azteca TaxID=294128 RepID=A0A8B7NZC4_HYAAZ|nr:uncharacterized protein LOC108675662 [Hyalella azteca]
MPWLWRWPALLLLLVQLQQAFTADTDFDRIQAMKAENPRLRVIVALGGTSIKSTSFAQVTSTKAAVANFSEQVVDFLRTRRMDGVEVDWRWPGEDGGSKDRDDLTLLIKTLRASLDELDDEHNRVKREGETDAETTATTELTIAAETDTAETVTDETVTDETATNETDTDETVFDEAATEKTVTDETATGGTSAPETGYAAAPASLSPGFDLTKMIGNFFSYAMGTSHGQSDNNHITPDLRREDEVRLPTSTTNIRSLPSPLPPSSSAPPSSSMQDNFEGDAGLGRSGRRGSVRFTDYYASSSAVGVRATSSAERPSSVPSEGWTWPTEGAAPREDAPKRPLLLLHLPSRPELLAKGYDLKKLASLVDMFSLGTDNLTSPRRPLNQTCHHARLMGVAWS